jgi:hypothetical protein
MSFPSSFRRLLIGLLGWSCAACCTMGQDFESEPIAYSKSKPNNRVAQFDEELQSGRVTLSYDSRFGYLPALLKALDVPQSSQMLVFSKTSLQRHRITSRTPRALYFNDDVYIGFCHDGDVLEISAADDQLGTVFYTLDQDAETGPKLIRQGDNCLICHAASATKQVPGHLVRSVYCDASGLPLLASSTYRTDYTSPFEQRWAAGT